MIHHFLEKCIHDRPLHKIVIQCLQSFMKYCPISTKLRNPASIQILLILSVCERLLIRSSYRCTRLLQTTQYNIEIFSCVLLLLPCFSSTCRQTNDDNTRNVSEDCLWFSRIQSLHHFLWTLQNRRLNILLVQTSVQILSLIGIVLVEESAGSRHCDFALAFDRLAKSIAFNRNAYSSNCTSEVSCLLLFTFVTNLFKPWEIPTQGVRIVLVKRQEFWSQLRTYRASNKLQLPLRVQFSCSLGSNILVPMLLHF